MDNGLVLTENAMKKQTQEESIEERFLNLYPSYDYSIKSVSKEKDIRKRKKMQTMY